MLIIIFFIAIGTSHLFVDAMHGGKAGKIEKVPHMAELYKNYKDGGVAICGATILSERWILTAAHCVKSKEDLKYSQVRVKAYTSYGEEGIFHNVSQIILHPKYSSDTRWNSDIALMKLIEPIKFDEKSQPIPISKEAPKVGNVISISGYGMDYELWGEVLKLGQQRVITRRTCRDAYKKKPQSKIKMDSRVFCAESSTLDLCGGDSGSPAVMNGEVVGVAVEGCESPLPNIYANVANYYDWIVNVTGIKFKSTKKTIKK